MKLSVTAMSLLVYNPLGAQDDELTRKFCSDVRAPLVLKPGFVIANVPLGKPDDALLPASTFDEVLISAPTTK